jgi:hypothetical protein
VPAGAVPVGVVTVGAVPAGVAPAAPVDVGVPAAGEPVARTCFRRGVLNLCPFRLGDSALDTLSAGPALTATRSALPTEDDRGGGDVVWSTARPEA